MQSLLNLHLRHKGRPAASRDASSRPVKRSGAGQQASRPAKKSEGNRKQVKKKRSDSQAVTSKRRKAAGAEVAVCGQLDAAKTLPDPWGAAGAEQAHLSNELPDPCQ